MKLGAIVWGLPEINIDTHNKLGAILKPYTQKQLAKLGIEKADTLWIGSCFNTSLIPMGEKSSSLDLQDAGDGLNAIGSKDPRDYLAIFKQKGFTHLLMVNMPFMVGSDMLQDKPVSEDAMHNLLLLMEAKENIHFIAQPNFDDDEFDDWDISPIIVDGFFTPIIKLRIDPIEGLPLILKIYLPFDEILENGELISIFSLFLRDFRDNNSSIDKLISFSSGQIILARFELF